GALGEPGTFVVFERCVSRAAQSDLAYRASACDRGTAASEVGGLFGRLGADSSEGAGRIARGSVRAERATGRNSRVARIRDRCRSASRSARLGAQADRPEARRARTESRVTECAMGSAVGRWRRGCKARDAGSLERAVAGTELHQQ